MKKYYYYEIIMAILALLFVMFVFSKMSKDESNVLKCHSSDTGIGTKTNTKYDVLFYFDKKNERVIKEEIVYVETIDEDLLGSYAEDIDGYYNATLCESIFSDNSTCKVTVGEKEVTINVTYAKDNLSKNLLTYNNMPKEQVKKYIEEASVFKCD